MLGKNRACRALVPAMVMVGLGLVGSSCQASLTFYNSFGSFNTALGGTGVNNVKFNSGLTTTGTTVQGATDNNLILSFTSTEKISLTISGGGQAKIETTASKGTFNQLLLQPVSSPLPNTGYLQAISFNAQTLNTTGYLTLAVTVKEPDGTTTVINSPDNFYANSNGNQEFGIIAAGGEKIVDVTLTADKFTGGLVALNNVGEVRIAAGPGDASVVPEPSTISMALAGLGLAALGAIRARRVRGQAPVA